MTPDDGPSRAERLQSLGIGYIDQYRRTGAQEDLDRFIQQFQEALDLTPNDDPSRAKRLQNLGSGYRVRYQIRKVREDLERAIQKHQEILDLTPNDGLSRAGQLRGLGIEYKEPYQRTGPQADLERSIRQFQDALDLTPNDDLSRAERLQNLGSGYGVRYQITGAQADLERSIEKLQEALDLTPNYDPSRAKQLQSLGTGYGQQYRRTRAQKDLDTAIQQHQEALDLTPNDDLSRVERLQSLGIGYGERYRRTGAQTDLERSIEKLQDALDLTPYDNPSRAGRLHDLGIGCMYQYQRTRARVDLERAIRQFQEALDLSPDDDPSRAERLRSLGNGYISQHRRTGAQADLDQAIQQLGKALNHSPSPPAHRITSGRHLLQIYAATDDWPSAYRVASIIIPLVPLLTSRSLENADKQHLLTQVTGLASDAAAITLTVGKSPYDAIQFLELGRGIITGSLNEMRVDVSHLQQAHPRIAEMFTDLRDQLDVTAPSREHSVDQRYSAGLKLEQTIQEIRQLAGFERFLLPPLEDELKNAAVRGPIVIVNVSDYRCDALIIKTSEVMTLRLPLLQSSDVRARAMQPVIDKELLEWLWETIAKPVLDILEFKQTPSSDGHWDRMWWIPTGLLTKLPIHAAGYHSLGSTNTVLDRVISSYSPSIRALVHSLQNRPTTKKAQELDRIVLVGMPELKYALEEIDKLENICSLMQIKASRPRPYHRDVLAALDGCKIFHFAGHGSSHPEDPSRSSLHLVDKPLTVANLFVSNLQSHPPFLAYLSACGTGQITNDGLIDEGLHLIGACQLAGFRHVIGTLWEVNDKSCVVVATMTYEWMKNQQMSDGSVSEGLHHALRTLRGQWISENAIRRLSKQGSVVQNARLSQINIKLSRSQAKPRDSRDIESCDDTPMYWVPYVHFGV